MRALKGLEDIISVDVVHWHLEENGWPFKDGYEDSLYGSKFVRELYFKAESDYGGRFTVPVLWDKKTQTIGTFNLLLDPFLMLKAVLEPYCNTAHHSMFNRDNSQQRKQ